MKRFAAAVLLGVCLFDSSPAAQAPAGAWQGEYQGPPRVVVTVDFDAGLAAFNDSPSFPITRRPAAADAPVVTFEVTAGPRTITFSGRRAGSTITGLFSAAGEQYPLSLARLPDDAQRLVATRSARYPLPAEPARYAREIAQARTAVAELIKAKQIPGLSVAIGRDGAIVWSEGFGFADVEQQAPVTPLTRFRLGSVSKVLTAAALARLVEDGRLDLDAPVQRYVPSFPIKPWPVTARQLAGHLAGIRHYQAADFTGPLKGAPHFDSVAKGLAIFQNDPLLFEPGTAYGYTSYGWNLIGAVIEAAAKQEFLTYIQSSVFEPLGLRHIAADHVYSIVPYRTRFYQRDARGELTNAEHVDNSYKWASGGFLSNAEDLVRFASAHLRPGFLRQPTLDLLFTSQQLRSGQETGVGLGWRAGIDPQGRRIWHHGGTIEGGRAMLMMFPESKVVVAILANVLADFGEPDAQKIGGMFIR